MARVREDRQSRLAGLRRERRATMVFNVRSQVMTIRGERQRSWRLRRSRLPVPFFRWPVVTRTHQSARCLATSALPSYMSEPAAAHSLGCGTYPYEARLVTRLDGVCGVTRSDRSNNATIRVCCRCLPAGRGPARPVAGVERDVARRRTPRAAGGCRHVSATNTETGLARRVQQSRAAATPWPVCRPARTRSM